MVKATAPPATHEAVAKLDEAITEADIALHLRNDEWRSLGAVVSIDVGRAGGSYDPGRRIQKLRAGIAVDEGIIDLQRLQIERAALLLDSVTDARQLATLEVSAKSASVVLAEAEATARQARSAFATAQAAIDSRTGRAAALRKEIAEHERAIARAELAREKEGDELRRLEQFGTMRQAMRSEPAG